ncbi:MAG: transporter associated domain-containing protein [Hyphomicrobiaceae bacterium]
MATEYSSSPTAKNGADAGSKEIQTPDVAGGEESRSTSGGQWLAALRTIVGLESPTLRDTIEDALKSEDRGDDAFTSQEREMLLRLLRYNALRVEDVMVPRADIIAVDETDSIGTVLQAFVEAGVSRMPLFHESLDDPRGMIHVKDIVRWMTQAATCATEAKAADKPLDQSTMDDTSNVNASSDLRRSFPELDFARLELTQPVASTKISRSVIFVPPSMPAMNLLLRMQSTRKHMALVVDEYGGTDGLVTIEDLIEQIVGQIEDEHDEDEERNITRDPRLGMVAAARTPIEELEKQLELSLVLDEDDDVDTLGGLVFALAGSVPVRGEIVIHPAGVEFEVLDADPRRIKRLRVSRIQSSSERDSGSGGGDGAD